MLDKGHSGRSTLCVGALTRRRYGRRARELGYAVIGVRTTGPEPGPDARVCEIAVVRMRGDGVVQREFSTLLDPRVPATWSGAHGIGHSDLIGAPSAGELAPHLAELFSGAVVAGHGLDALGRTLDTEFLPAGLPGDLPGLCTLLSLRSQTDLEDYSLARASYALNGRWPTARHSALGDARACARLLAELLKNAPGELRYVGPEPVHRGGRDVADRPEALRVKRRISSRGTLPTSEAPESGDESLAAWPHRWRPLELNPALCIEPFGPEERAAAAREAVRRSRGRRALAATAAVTGALAATAAARTLARRRRSASDFP